MSLWFKDALERATATAGQVFLSLVGVVSFTDVASIPNVINIPWQANLGVVATAFALSFVKSVVARLVSDSISPASLAKE